MEHPFLMRQSKGLIFIKNIDEPCAYKKVSGSALTFLVLYVDDILLIGNDIPMLQSVQSVGYQRTSL